MFSHAQASKLAKKEDLFDEESDDHEKLAKSLAAIHKLISYTPPAPKAEKAEKPKEEKPEADAEAEKPKGDDAEKAEEKPKEEEAEAAAEEKPKEAEAEVKEEAEPVKSPEEVLAEINTGALCLCCSLAFWWFSSCMNDLDTLLQKLIVTIGLALL